MNFIIAVSKDMSTFRMCDSIGNSSLDITIDDLNRLKNKICSFDINKMAIYDEDEIIVNSITVLGKYYYGHSTKYLVCDGNIRRKSLTREELIEAYKNNTNFSNIKIGSDGKIRMLKGSIPFIESLNYLKNTNNTITKLSSIEVCTPGCLGVSKKMLGKRVSDNRVGCVKFELFPGSYDIYNEVVAYKLGKMLGFDVAEASIEYYNNIKCVFSVYKYNIGTEVISSLKNEIGANRFHSEFNKEWITRNKSESTWNKFIQMVMLDLIMHQTDRNINNIAFKGNELYSLYDNGRSLFFDSFDDVVRDINLDNREELIKSFFLNEHGYGWNYLEGVLGYDSYKHLINHNLKYSDFLNIMNDTYGNKDAFRNRWLAKYMHRVYLIVTHQEGRW